MEPVKRYTQEDLLYEGKRALAVRRLNQAVSNGTMQRAQKCQICNLQCKTQGHHYKGYDYWFDVWWLCSGCNIALRGRNMHNGSITFEDARRIVIGRRFKKPEHYFRWLSKQKDSCQCCGVPDYIGNMALIFNDYKEGDLIICQRCAYQLLGDQELVDNTVETLESWLERQEIQCGICGIFGVVKDMIISFDEYGDFVVCLNCNGNVVDFHQNSCVNPIEEFANYFDIPDYVVV